MMPSAGDYFEPLMFTALYFGASSLQVFFQIAGISPIFPSFVFFANWIITHFSLLLAHWSTVFLCSVMLEAGLRRHHEDISHMPASYRSRPIPKLPLLSLRASLVGITWSPQEKPNQASSKLSSSFVCRQNSAVENPLLSSVNHLSLFTNWQSWPRRMQLTGGVPRSLRASSIGIRPLQPGWGRDREHS